VLIIPLLVLRELRLRKGEVYAFAFIYLIGSASILASILRYAFIRVAYRDGLKYQAHNSSAYEAVYLSTDLDEKIKVWTTVEYCTASIAFCLPSLRNLLRRGGPGGGGLLGRRRRRRVELNSTGSRRRSSREESTYVSVSTVKERRESQAELTLPTPPQPVMVVTQR
jgi:hypothetical protein